MQACNHCLFKINTADQYNQEITQLSGTLSL